MNSTIAKRAAKNDREYDETVIQCAREMQPMCTKAGISLNDFLALHLAFTDVLAQNDVDDGSDAASIAYIALKDDELLGTSTLPEYTDQSWFVDALSKVISDIRYANQCFNISQGSAKGQLILQFRHGGRPSLTQILNTANKTKWQISKDFYTLAYNADVKEL